MPGGRFRDSLGWLKSAPTFLGRGQGETLNTKGKLVGMDMDVILDRGSTPLTSRKIRVLLCRALIFLLLQDRSFDVSSMFVRRMLSTKWSVFSIFSRENLTR